MRNTSTVNNASISFAKPKCLVEIFTDNMEKAGVILCNNQHRKILAQLLWGVLMLFSCGAVKAQVYGTAQVCVGSTITLTDTSITGIWESGIPTIASIDSISGVLSGIEAGTVEIYYTTGSATDSFTVTVNPAPPAIAGDSTIVVGDTLALFDSVPGGVWTSSSPINASMNPGTGVLTGNMPGSTIVTYKMPVSGCFSSINVSVYDLSIVTWVDSVNYFYANKRLYALMSGGNSVDTNLIAPDSVVGINDGFNQNGSNNYYSGYDGNIHINGDSLPSPIPGLLANDIHADSFINLTVVHGFGTLNITSGSKHTAVFYTPGAHESGMILLAYTPYNSALNKVGGRTYVFMAYVYNNLCGPVTACEYVPNGNFNSPYNVGCGSDAPDIYVASIGAYTSSATICNWSPFINDADLYTAGCYTLVDGISGWPASSPFIDGCSYTVSPPSGGSGGFIGLWGGYDNNCGVGWQGEGIQAQLAYSLTPGAQYVISFWARVAVDPPCTPWFSYINAPIQFFISSSDMTGYIHGLGGGYGCEYFSYSPTISTLTPIDPIGHPTGWLINASITTPVNPEWQYCTATFTTSVVPVGGPQFIQVVNAPYYLWTPAGTPPPNGNFVDYIFVDDISIQPATMTVAATYSPTPLCTGDILCLNGVISGGTAGYTYNWIDPTSSIINSGTLGTSGIVPTFCSSVGVTPANDGVYLLSITDAAGCTAVGSTTVTVNAAGYIAGINTVTCSNTTTLADPLGVGGGTWNVTPSSVAVFSVISTSPPTIVVTTVGIGTAIATYSVTGSCGPSSATYTVISLPINSSTTTTMSLCDVPTTITDLSGYNGGTWTSSDPTLVTVSTYSVVPPIAIVTPLATTGTVVVTYSLSSTCGLVDDSYIINLSPAVNLSSTLDICGDGVFSGVMSLLTSSLPFGGNWYVDPTYGTYGILSPTIPSTTAPPQLSYYVSWIGAIEAVEDYSVNVDGCVEEQTFFINIYWPPNPGSIIGPSALCIGETAIFSNPSADPSLAWNSSDPTIASVTATSLSPYDIATVQGVGAGTATISLTVSNICGSLTATTTLTVYPTPTVTTIPDQVICGSPTLTTTVTGGSGGYTYAWSPGTGLSCTDCGNPTATISGTTITYTVTVTDNITGCSNSTTVTLTDPPCKVCITDAGGPLLFASSGSYGSPGVTTTLPPGFYYLNNDVTLYGNVVMTDVVMNIASGVTITVDPASSLSLYGSHFYSCYMWQGIVLASDGVSQTGVITLEADNNNISTLIEDAQTAISVISPISPNSYSANYITSNGAVYNKCYTGIYIDNYTYLKPVVYEFDIENSVFTKRDFSDYYIALGYPMEWPSTIGSGAYDLKVPWAAPDYVSPYNISNPTGDPSGAIGYPGIGCNVNPGYRNIIGIQLQNVGLPDNTTYPGIVIGAPNNNFFYTENLQQNIFDTLNYGINALYSNFTVHNSVFSHMSRSYGSWGAGPTTGSTGIYAFGSTSHKYEMIIEPSTAYVTMIGRTYTVTSTNYFYNCPYGVGSANYYHTKGNCAYMITTQQLQKGFSGYIGYDITSERYDSVFLNSNIITNVANGISFTSLYTLLSGSYIEGLGQVEANANTITAALGGTAPTWQYVSYGISLQNALNYTTHAHHFTVAGWVEAEGNNMANVFRGIWTNNYWMQTAYTTDNTITVLQDPYNVANYGISNTDCIGAQVSENTVTYAGGATSNTQAGIYAENNTDLNSYCNHVDGMNMGFEFSGNNPTTTWHNNQMQNNSNGLYINNGYIGTQGSISNPIDNTWLGTWSATNWQTYVNGFPAATSSTLYVRSGGLSIDPVFNGAVPSANKYIAGTSINSGAAGRSFVCPILIKANPTITALEKVSQQQLALGTNVKPGYWMAQHHVWRSVNMDSTLTDSSDVLQNFQSMSVGTRFDQMTSIEDNLVAGNLTTAVSLLTTTLPPNTDSNTATGVKLADYSTADYIVGHYTGFYGSYVNYASGAMTSADSSNIAYLAGLCPLKHGEVVFKARAMYPAIFHDLPVWNDTCTLDSTDYLTEREIPNIVPNTESNSLISYEIAPNPNDGNITIIQFADDVRPVSIQVQDVLGQKVYASTVIFENGLFKLSLPNIAKGVYLLEILNADRQQFNFKFVVE